MDTKNDSTKDALDAFRYFHTIAEAARDAQIKAAIKETDEEIIKSLKSKEEDND